MSSLVEAAESVQQSAYAPSICTGCSKRGLQHAAASIQAAWTKQFVQGRASLLARSSNLVAKFLDERIDDEAGGDEQLVDDAAKTIDQFRSLEVDELPGIDAVTFSSLGIVSDCCKMELLTYIPWDVWRWMYLRCDSVLPCDFFAHGIRWNRMNNLNGNGGGEEAGGSTFQKQPAKYGLVGTRDQYSV